MLAKASGIKQEYERRIVSNIGLPKANEERPDKILRNIIKLDIIKLPDKKIVHAVGAKNINDDVLAPTTGEAFQIAHGKQVTNIEIFAGNGVKTPYRSAAKYIQRYGGKPEN